MEIDKDTDVVTDIDMNMKMKMDLDMNIKMDVDMDMNMKMEWTQDVDMDIDIHVPKRQVGSNWQVLLYKSMEILNPYMEYGKILFLESQEFRGCQCQFWRKCGSGTEVINSCGIPWTPFSI